MKIVSKFKDYYDFQMGTYGVDERLVLDRREFTPIPYPREFGVDTFYIGEWEVQGLWKDNVFYIGKDVEQFAFKTDYSRYKWYTSSEDHSDSYVIKDTRYGNAQNVYCLKGPKFIGDKSPTWKEDCPILIQEYNGYKKHPILREYNIQKVLPPHEVWVILSDWLSKSITKKEPEMPVGDDKIRLVSAGFDLKTSFRNVK